MSDWTAADLPSFTGRTVIVTGANSEEVNAAGDTLRLASDD